MNVWNFKVKSDSQEITEKLQSAFGAVNGFVLHLENDNIGQVSFKIRKRILYAFQTILRNHIIAKGKIKHSKTENGTDVEICFKQHFFNKLEISVVFILGLWAICLGILRSNPTASLLGGMILGVGFVLLIFIQRQFTKNIQEYKKLFTDVLEL